MSAREQTQFLEVIDRDEAERRFRAALDLSPLESEIILISRTLDRILAEDVLAPIDVPAFDRANVDGFAVQAADTFGSAEDSPRTLRLNQEILRPGVQPHETLRAGTATSIATGAMLPRGADAVVMIEYTEIRDGQLNISRPVVPGANVTFTGTDVGQGEVVLRRGEQLSARETAVLAALGVAQVRVIRQPRVAILSTGNELLQPGQPIRLGCVYDSNSTMLADSIRELGGEPIPLGIFPDDDEALDRGLRLALEYDMVLLSGGTSKGEGDLAYRAVARLGKPGIVAHGIALKPGKPLCLAVIDRPSRRPLPVAVLPGFPTSAIFTFHEFLAPVLRRWAGRQDEATTTISARLPFRVNSERGRTEYLLVGLVESRSEVVAYPMGKGSGSVTAFARADGFVVIPRQREYLEAGSVVEVRLLAKKVKPADLVVIGSHCTGLDFLLGLLHEQGWTSKVLNVGSQGGLEAVRRGECDLAGVHLLDPYSDRYNEPFVTEEIVLVSGYIRRQGIVHRRGDERFEKDRIDKTIRDPECVMVNRNRGSGTRLLIDRLLGEARPAGYLCEAKSHHAVVAAVAQGRADWGVAIEPVARAAGLTFHELQEERYDFLIPRERQQRPVVQAFVALLHDPFVRQQLAERGFPAE